MCNQVPSVTLQTAVLMQVKDFANQNQPFSVFDITRTLRDKTNKGEIEIPEVEVTNRGYRFDIQHAKVKELFNELWDTGVFDPDFTLSKAYTGMYFTYTPAPVCGGTPSVATVSAPSVAPVSPVASPVQVAKVKTAESDVITRVESYLNGCEQRNYRPTLKQVQSAIKRGDVSTGWTCEELKTLIETQLGYSVVDNPDYLSASQVAVV